MSKLKNPYLLLPQQAESLHPHIDWQRTCAEWHVFLENFQENVIQPVTKAFQIVAEAIQPTLKPMVETMQHINGVVYASYLENGAIYGETQEGYLRWLRESGEIEHLRKQAERMQSV